MKDGRKVKDFTWLALREDYVYFVESTVDLDKFDARAAEIDQMFSSFGWGKPPEGK